VHQLVRAKAGLARLAVDELEVTVLFSDIESFTKVCEHMGVGDKLLHLMSDYFTAMAEIITGTGGCLLEFIGDAILAVWNAPNAEELHAVRAVTAALEMHAKLEKLHAEWDAKGYPRIRIRCGIHTAKVLVGNIGAPNRMKYGVLGDGVNTASRLEETNKRYGTRLLISDATYKQITGNSGSSLQRHLFKTRPLDRVVFKGKTRTTTLYEVCGFNEEDCSPTPGDSLVFDDRISLQDPSAFAAGRSVQELKDLVLRLHYRAWKQYLRRNFQEAAQLFQTVDDFQTRIGPRTVLSGRPDDFGDVFSGDRAAQLLAERCRWFVGSPPPAGWNGAEVLHDKHF